MINNNRIVPITATDLISMYGLILVVGAATAPEKLDADTVLGDFSEDTTAKTVIASQPLRSLNFGASVAASTVYFVPSSDFKGFTKTGATLTVTGEVEAGSASLYSATLSTNALTIAKVGF
ncbi:MAG: hypothetical protein K6F27_13430 [Ruminococcus sp.]|nr:hypothetical protein [Ruminococcus sp.]